MIHNLQFTIYAVILIFILYCRNAEEESEVKPLIRIAFSKITKDLTAKEIKQGKNQEYLFYILRKIIKRTKVNKKASRKIALVVRLGWKV